MEEPLWIDEYAPDIGALPQADVRESLRRAVDEPLNLVVHGPAGAGKTAAVRALARETHAEPAADLVEINVADVFDRSKSELGDDPRFAPFLAGRSRLSKRDMLNRVIREVAANGPVTGEYRTVLLDDAESIREDFQQALRRVMERHARSTRFVIATRQPSKLLAPVRSRCFPVPVRAPTHEETVAALERIVSAAGVEHDEDGLAYVAGYGGGNLRKSILGAQTTAETEGAVTMAAAYEALGDVGVGDRVASMLDDAEAGAFEDARSTLDELLYDEGFSGEEVLAEVLDVARSRYEGERLAEVHALAGEVDLDLTEATTDRVHLAGLLADLAPE